MVIFYHNKRLFVVKNNYFHKFRRLVVSEANPNIMNPDTETSDTEHP